LLSPSNTGLITMIKSAIESFDQAGLFRLETYTTKRNNNSATAVFSFASKMTKV
jgi:hypothetical protein